MPFALILHELATNAVKYGAWASAQGRTVIEWRLSKERQFEFRWREEDAAQHYVVRAKDSLEALEPILKYVVYEG